MKQIAAIMSVLLIAPAICLGFARPSTAGEPIQFSGSHTFNKPDQHHSAPVGDDPDHVLGLFTSSGVNKSTGKTPFLDAATETEVVYYDVMKGNGPHHGFIFYKAADGTLLNEFNGYGRVIIVDGKPQSFGVGWWHTVAGTGRYANGTGSGTYTTRLALPDFEGATEWDGTFVEGGK
jgi:hypothetical protein